MFEPLPDDWFFLDSDTQPTLLRIIYEEGKEGRHLLFSAEEIALMECRMTPADFCLPQDSADILENIAIALASATSLSAMKELISSLSREIKTMVYILYRRSLDMWISRQRLMLN